MNWYKNRKISSKLIIAFMVVAVVAGIIGVIGLFTITATSNLNKRLYEENVVGFQLSSEGSAQFQKLRYSTIELTELFADADKERVEAEIDDILKKLDTRMAGYKSLSMTDDEMVLFSNLEKDLTTYKTYVQQVIELVDKSITSKAADVILKDAKSTGDSIIDKFEQLAQSNAVEAAQKTEDNQTITTISVWIMIGIMLFAIILSFIFGRFISRLIGSPLVKMTGVAGKLAKGDVDVSVSISSSDEIGQLGTAFTELLASTKEQAQVMQSIAEGNLTKFINIRSDNDLLGKSLVELLTKLNQTIETIVVAAEQVASGSDMLSTSSFELSQGATEQASSIQELTASLEEVSSQTARNAADAMTANALARNAEANAVEGNSQMQDMLAAMTDISESSNNINKIIKVIDDIAFQTNILALNAAVEAARAGQHGKGFAVVAEEVRNLAAKSANAAKETTDLIESSIKKVEAGTKIANSTAEALNTIVGQVKEAAELVSRIALASNVQSAGVAQINQGILQISRVVQTNAATAEESAAASEELSSQAAQLKETVSVFKLKRRKTQSAPLLSATNKKPVISLPALKTR